MTVARRRFGRPDPDRQRSPLQRGLVPPALAALHGRRRHGRRPGRRARVANVRRGIRRARPDRAPRRGGAARDDRRREPPHLRAVAHGRRGVGHGDDRDGGARRRRTASSRSRTSATAARTSCATAHSSGCPRTTRWCTSSCARGELSEVEAEQHPQRSVITRALGTDEEVQIDTFTLEAKTGDVLLLCTDGLNTMISEPDIAGALAIADHGGRHRPPARPRGAPGGRRGQRHGCGRHASESPQRRPTRRR